MKGRKRHRRRKVWRQQPSRVDFLYGGLHPRGTCNYACGVAYAQKERLQTRRRVWYRWIGKPGDLWGGCRKGDPGAVAPLRTLMYV